MIIASKKNMPKAGASKATLLIAAAIIANAVVLYLSVTDHSPDYLQGMSASEARDITGPRF